MKKHILDLLIMSKEPLDSEDIFKYVCKFGDFTKEHMRITLLRLERRHRIKKVNGKYIFFDALEYEFKNIIKEIGEMTPYQIITELQYTKGILSSLYLRYPSIMKKVDELLAESRSYHDFRKLQLEEVFIDVKQ